MLACCGLRILATPFGQQLQERFVRRPLPNEMLVLISRFFLSHLHCLSETLSFAQQGGIIEFFITKNKLHFKINVDAAQRADLTISSELLKLARIVRTKRKEQ